MKSCDLGKIGTLKEEHETRKREWKSKTTTYRPFSAYTEGLADEPDAVGQRTCGD